MNNEDQYNQGGMVAKGLQKINRALLYIIVSIFIGNLFVGAILGNTPKVNIPKAKALEGSTNCTLKQKGETNPISNDLWRVTVSIECTGDPFPDQYIIGYKDERGYQQTDFFRGPLEKPFDMHGDGPFEFSLYAYKGNNIVANAYLIATPPGGCKGLGDEVVRAKQRVDTIEAAANNIIPDDPNSVYAAAAEAHIFKKDFLAVFCHIGNAMDPNFADPNQYTQLNPEIKAQIVRYQKIINEKILPAQKNIANIKYIEIGDQLTPGAPEIGIVSPTEVKGWVPESYRKGIGDLINTNYLSDLDAQRMTDSLVQILLEVDAQADEAQIRAAKQALRNRFTRLSPTLFILMPITLQPILVNAAQNWRQNANLKGNFNDRQENLNQAMRGLIQTGVQGGPGGNGYEIGLYQLYDLYLNANGKYAKAIDDLTDPNSACKKQLFANVQISTWFQDAICEMLGLIISSLKGMIEAAVKMIDSAEEMSKNLLAEKVYAATNAPLRDPNFWVIPSWKVMLSAVNVVIIIFLLVIAFSNILRINIDTYVIKKTLPGLVLGVILANFSLLITRMVVDFSEVLVQAFKNDGGSASSLLGASTLTLLLGSGATAGIGAIVGGIIGSWPGVAIGVLIGALIPITLFALGMLSLWFMLVARRAIIYLLVVVSPLAFISAILPFGSTYFKKWWGMFITWVFMWPIIQFIFWIAAKIKVEEGKFSITNLLVVIALTYAAIMMPFTLGGSLAKIWGGIGATILGGGGLGALMGKKTGEARGSIGLGLYTKLRTSRLGQGWLGKMERKYGEVSSGKKDILEGLAKQEKEKGALRVLFRYFGTSEESLQRQMQDKVSSKAGGLDTNRVAVDSIEGLGGLGHRYFNPSTGAVFDTERDGGRNLNPRNLEEAEEIANYFAAVGALERISTRSPQADARYNEAVTALGGITTRSRGKGVYDIYQAGAVFRGRPHRPFRIPNSGGIPIAATASPLQRPDAQGQMVRYGQYDNRPTIIDEQIGKEIKNPNYGEIDVDFNAARGAWKEIEPALEGLGEQEARRKVTGFVHAHEAFHDIAANKLSPEARKGLKVKDANGQELEERLADAYARQALDLGDEQTKARDRKTLDDFKTQLPEDSRGLMDLKYEGEGDNNLLLGLHRAGLEYGKISNARLSETSTHAGLGLDRPAPAEGEAAPSPAPVAEGAPTAGSAPALTKEEQEEEVRQNAYIGGVREEYHRETEKIVEKTPEDAAGSKLLGDDKTLRVARLITGRLTVRPNEEQRYNHALYESALQGIKGTEQKLRVALEQPTSGVSKAKVEAVVQAVRTTPAPQLSQKLQTEYQITPEIQARLKPNIAGLTSAVNVERIAKNMIANKELDVTQPLRVKLAAELQKGTKKWGDLDNIQNQLKGLEKEFSVGRVPPVKLRAAQEIMAQIRPDVKYQIEGANSQPELLAKMKQFRTAYNQLSMPEVRRAMERGSSPQEVEMITRLKTINKIERDHNVNYLNNDIKLALQKVQANRPNIPREQLSINLEQEVARDVNVIQRVKDTVNVQPVVSTQFRGLDAPRQMQVSQDLAKRFARQAAANVKIDSNIFAREAQAAIQKAAAMPVMPKAAPRVSIARPASQPIAKPMSDIRPIPEKPAPSQWETQDVKPIIATRK